MCGKYVNKREKRDSEFGFSYLSSTKIKDPKNKKHPQKRVLPKIITKYGNITSCKFTNSLIFPIWKHFNSMKCY